MAASRKRPMFIAIEGHVNVMDSCLTRIICSAATNMSQKHSAACPLLHDFLCSELAKVVRRSSHPDAEGLLRGYLLNLHRARFQANLQFLLVV